MKKFVFLFSVFLLCSGHDMFLKMETYFWEPNTKSTIKLFNGTFDKSDNIITRDRMIDVSLIGEGKRMTIDSSSWFDSDKTTILNITTGQTGTWVAGVSTKPRDIDLDAESFNDYLKHDGVLDILQMRKDNNILNEDAVEKYSKHVKTIFQVGEHKTNDWQQVLGYPVEFVPLTNPYHSSVGDKLKVKLLWLGKPISNQLVYAGNAATSHSHDHNDDHHHHHHHTEYRTDENGIVALNLNESGEWFLRTIIMKESTEPDLDYESNWATLTFAIPKNSMNTLSPESTGNGSMFSSGMLKLFLIAVIIILGIFIIMKTRGGK